MNTESNFRPYPWEASYPQGVSWDLQVEPEPIHALLEQASIRWGDQVAADFLDKTWTWNEILSMARKMAKGLQDMGVKKGTKVGLLLPNTPYFIISYYAISMAGGTIVHYNPLYAKREIKHQIEDSETDIMVTLDLKLMMKKMAIMLDETRLQKVIVCPFTKILPPVKAALFSIFKFTEKAWVPREDVYARFADVIKNDGDYDHVDYDLENDVALLQYTGGTTGIPKGAMLTHSNLYWNVVQSRTWFPDIQDGKETMLAVLPFFHVFAMTAVMNLSVLMGAKIVLVPRFDLKDVLKTIVKKAPTLFPAVPTIYAAINNYAWISDYNLSSIRYCISGGAPLPVDVKREFEKRTGCVLVEGYGLSETSPVATINPAVKGHTKEGSIGLPIPATVVEIISPEGGRTPLPIGERGEICISGPQVMKGYWKKDEATEEVFRDGRLHTGDVGIMDEEGFVTIVDRIKDMILTNGYNVYPRNVEEAIYLHPAVAECIVAGVPDKKRGEMVKAWIYLKLGAKLDEEELLEFLSDKISKIEKPREVEFRKEPLPKTMIGKLSKKDVLEEEMKARADKEA